MAETHETTGRYLVLLRRDRTQEGIQTLVALTGVSTTQARPEAGLSLSSQLSDDCVLVFDHLGVALVRCAPAQHAVLKTAVSPDSDILAIEPERSVYALNRADTESSDSPYSEESVSWGVQATRAASSPYSGKGIRLAILDTGLDLLHPDFQNRNIRSLSFVSGQDVQDENGHGTHCAGIAGGPSMPIVGPRYGVAGDVNLYAGKVLSDEGRGADGSVLEGINWAVENGCEIISMSLGTTVQADQAYSQIFEEVAKRALDLGVVIIAAAGNDSQRPKTIAPVAHPANCPSILAVAAIDQHMQIAPFSSGGLMTGGGQVDVAAPGVAVMSSWPMPQRYQTLSGTSMATPFVAGIAAMQAQADPQCRGRTLFDWIREHVTPLDLPARDIGAGLILAP